MHINLQYKNSPQSELRAVNEHRISWLSRNFCTEKISCNLCNLQRTGKANPPCSGVRRTERLCPCTKEQISILAYCSGKNPRSPPSRFVNNQWTNGDFLQNTATALRRILTCFHNLFSALHSILTFC